MILMYHNVIPEFAPLGQKQQSISLIEPEFIRQVSILNSIFTIIPLSTYISKKKKIVLDQMKFQ